MVLLRKLRSLLISPVSATFSILGAVLLMLAFPDVGLWPLAWIALVPLIVAVEREKESIVGSFVVGAVFGTTFFFASCWWLTFAPIQYAGVPAVVAYLLLLVAAVGAGVFPGIFGAVLGYLLRRGGPSWVLAAPFVWIATEFLRLGLTGNNWNAIGYSQAFIPEIIAPARVGGVYLVGVVVVTLNVHIAFKIFSFLSIRNGRGGLPGEMAALVGTFALVMTVFVASELSLSDNKSPSSLRLIAVQPNVPMDGTAYARFPELLATHVNLAERALQEDRTADLPSVVVFPESPMMFQYGVDEELRGFMRDFTRRNNTAIIFNSAERRPGDTQVSNSALLVSSGGEKVGQYDKIHLLPFGEFIPLPSPLAEMMPAFVGNFRAGEDYTLLSIGETRAGVMICFETQFGSLSREFTRRGADVLIEMTNDGYLGNTPVLRQHLANSIFRAVETNRPVVRATNVGITALIEPDGEVRDAAPVYDTAVRSWKVPRSAGDVTPYVRFGDWFAWLCLLLLIGSLVAVRFVKLPISAAPGDE